jgi:hypothetical protein
VKEIDYDKVIEFITKIGYKQRTGTYYVIREEDGYINISCDKCFHPEAPIIFHKNHYQGVINKNGFPKKDISHKFSDLESFFEFISEYHNKLLLKNKIKKINENIKNHNTTV